ncbi:unnamed protein product, partial [Strongylus vulgaris]
MSQGGFQGRDNRNQSDEQESSDLREGNRDRFSDSHQPDGDWTFGEGSQSRGGRPNERFGGPGFGRNMRNESSGFGGRSNNFGRENQNDSYGRSYPAGEGFRGREGFGSGFSTNDDIGFGKSGFGGSGFGRSVTSSFDNRDTSSFGGIRDDSRGCREFVSGGAYGDRERAPRNWNPEMDMIETLFKRDALNAEYF